MKIYAGFDGGGSKTTAVVADENGRLLGTGIGGPSNYLYCGKETAARSVRDACLCAFEQAGLAPVRLHAAYVSSAAILLGHGEAHLAFFAGCIEAERLICESDIYPIWYGAVREAPAVISIVGTGAITYVLSHEGYTRVGGYGPLLGDEGSGYDLALRGARLACRMYDGRADLDKAFLDAIFAHYEADTPLTLLRVLNRDDIRSKVASGAQKICELYDGGNRAAAALLAQSADEIALAITTAANRSACEKPLAAVLSGGLVKPGRPLFELLKERLLQAGSPISAVCCTQVHPAVASAALALRSQGREEAAERLMQNAEGVLL